MIKIEKDQKFNLVVVEVYEDRFAYKRENQRDNWVAYFSTSLPINLEVKVGKKYTGQSMVTTEKGIFVSWQREFKEK